MKCLKRDIIPNENLILTSKETHVVAITKTNLLTIFKEIMAACENQMKHINTLCWQAGSLNSETGGKFSYCCTSEC